MSVQLLDKTRKINRLLRDTQTSKVVFNDICEEIGSVLMSNMLVISRKGKILGVGLYASVPPLDEFFSHVVGELLLPEMNERFLSVLSTNENVNLAALGFPEACAGAYYAIVVPIEIAGERLGTVFLYKTTCAYGIDDIIISEYSTTVVGLEMMRAMKEEDAEEARKRQLAQSAIGTLSGSEVEAIRHVLAELGDQEGILVASKIADRYGITRSVIVNAIRKFESAGLIESHSSGMKGTYIKIMNETVLDEMEKISGP
ncbi:MAG: GTP-sensing pleiotropic transcriptional regulator CodY [Lachnospiraceae bacterium]|nr:GTP-sensing pleiotropic transcriptional regulator CodY [Lachnospiraceae bacterium]